VRVRSQAGLGRLSLSNQLLVALARPDATFVAGFKSWLQIGYAVKKGECGIAIIAPLPIKDRDRVSGEETGETLVLFKTVFVFDRAQVAPIEGAEQMARPRGESDRADGSILAPRPGLCAARDRAPQIEVA
jgi:antirestriction factor ArdC-like protein